MNRIGLLLLPAIFLSLPVRSASAEIIHEPYSVVTVAGIPQRSGSSDGAISSPWFTYPTAIAIDSSGNMYISDLGNNVIRKRTPDGNVVILAGKLQSPGSADGTGSAARFNYPQSLAVDSAGNLYLADQGNYTIRKITREGVVTTLAGLAGSSGSVDGVGSAARFVSPYGVVLDGAGNLFVTDVYGDTVRKVTLAGVVTTIAGSPTNAGSADGAGSAARFSSPYAITIDNSANLYVADGSNRTIRKIDPNGDVTTIAGLAGASGNVDGVGANARFVQPLGIAIDQAGNLFVSDPSANTVRKIAPGGAVTTLAGSAYQSGYVDANGSAARFHSALGLATASNGNVYLADGANNAVRCITPDATVTTLAGHGGYFGSLSGIALTAGGDLVIADRGGPTIRKISADGIVTTFAGVAGQSGYTDGIGNAARFSNPQGVALDDLGNIFVADGLTIRKITPDAVVTTLAGYPVQSGTTDGTGSNARFSGACSLAVGPDQNIYVADSSNSTIRKVTPGGVVTTLAGSPGGASNIDGNGSAARFYNPTSVAADRFGNIFVADTSNHTIRKVTSSGTVTTIAGTPGTFGNDDGTGGAARFNLPGGVAVDSAGNIFISDTRNNTLRKINPNGVVSTIAGVAQTNGTTDGVGTLARFSQPTGLAVTNAGRLLICDSWNYTLRSAKPNAPAISSISVLSSTKIRLQCVGVPDVMNRIESSPSLDSTSFSTQAFRLSDENGTFIYDDPNPGTKKSYRLAYP